ncbi:hypothetical protein [uncultured Bacteroides sp.]
MVAELIVERADVEKNLFHMQKRWNMLRMNIVNTNSVQSVT